MFNQKLSQDYKKVTRAFRGADKNHDGFIELGEFRRLLSKYNIEMSDGEFQKFCELYACLSTGDHKVSFAEFQRDFGLKISGDVGNGSFIGEEHDPSSRVNRNKQQQRQQFVTAEAADECFTVKLRADFSVITGAFMAFDK